MIIGSVLLSGCGDTYEFHSEGEFRAPEGNALKTEIEFRAGPDFWDDSNLRNAFSLNIKNLGPGHLTGCSIVVDGKYRAVISDLEIFLGFWKGNRPRGSSEIQSGEVVEFSFSHDDNNKLAIRSPSDESYPTKASPNSIGLECKEGQFRWEVGENLK